MVLGVCQSSTRRKGRLTGIAGLSGYQGPTASLRLSHAESCNICKYSGETPKRPAAQCPCLNMGWCAGNTHLVGPVEAVQRGARVTWPVWIPRASGARPRTMACPPAGRFGRYYRAPWCRTCEAGAAGGPRAGRRWLGLDPTGPQVPCPLLGLPGRGPYAGPAARPACWRGQRSAGPPDLGCKQPCKLARAWGLSAPGGPTLGALRSSSPQ